EATVALAGAGGIPGVVHRLVLALFVVDPTELSVRPLLDRGRLLRVALGLSLGLAVEALLLADLIFGLALDHAGIVVTAEDIGGAADVRPLRLRQARVIEGANLVHRLLEAIVGAVDLAGVALAGLGERCREGVDVLLDRLPHVRVFLAVVVEGVSAEGLLEVTADLAHLLAVPAAAALLVDDLLDVPRRGGGALGHLLVDVRNHAANVFVDLFATLAERRREGVLDVALELSECVLVVEPVAEISAELGCNALLDALEARYDLNERRTSAIHPSHCNLFLSPVGPVCAARPPSSPGPLFARGPGASCLPSAFRSKSPLHRQS